jgi:hypothetical protein
MYSSTRPSSCGPARPARTHQALLSDVHFTNQAMSPRSTNQPVFVDVQPHQPALISDVHAGGAGGSAEMNGSTVRMYVRDQHGRRVALEQTPILRMAAIGSRGAAGGPGGARAAGTAAPTPRYVVGRNSGCSD